MPMLFQTTRLSVGAALSLAAACALAADASAQVLTPLFIGPDRVGSAVTYRLTTSDDHAGSAPNVQTLALQWKLGQKIVMTLTSAGDAQATPYVATRAADAGLTLDNVSADDPEGQRMVIAIGVLNRLKGFVAAAPAGAKAWNTTLVVQPRAVPTRDAQSTPAPQPLNIPVSATRSDDATGTTLAASGAIDRTMTRPAGGGSGRGGAAGDAGGMGGGMGRGGRMGGGGMGGGRRSGSSALTMTTQLTVNAHFARDGALTSGTIVETSQAAGDQSRSSTRSWRIERASS
jgi:hypothetical protein